ncbi:MotA/TolQ/ExbB proton channel family protein [Liberibacter crescens BT-1]|uniref:MotA/TolQ/ExbB proton channel family protein n=1 Tax=Liberibacter crescens (strain BT-1) TaxID=1215343 RepID=L0EVG3_LIBCB|nr:hypothetical protein [Liberibacter crescens]AGA64850.1 MotA/TolQ/ExbB proton channel family protein [Liberibacter crescens BT-1]AMC12899.1 flagellar motor protein MotA [Liberibacter crescens]
MKNSSQFTQEKNEEILENRGSLRLFFSPAPFLLTIFLFLIIVSFLVAILFRRVQVAFMHNPGLNTLIISVMLIGILLVISNLLSLGKESRWFNNFLSGNVRYADRFFLVSKFLSPTRLLVGIYPKKPLPLVLVRNILDFVSSRLDETRDTWRYLVGLLVFLGLLGTFWGLIDTITSINSVIQSLDVGGHDSADILSSLKQGLSAPLSGMGSAFSSSLLGLSGSLILGFLDLQAGRAQGRFYTELENTLSQLSDVSFEKNTLNTEMSSIGFSEEMRRIIELLSQVAPDAVGQQRSATAMSALAEGVQALVKNMRKEQQMLRNWVEVQRDESRSMCRMIERLIEQRHGKDNNGIRGE